MDVILNATENRTKCDDQNNFGSIDKSKTLNASNEITESSASLFIDKNIDVNRQVRDTNNFQLTENFNLNNNNDKVSQMYKNQENNFIRYPDVVKSENENIVRRSLDNIDIYNSDSKFTCKSNTSTCTDNTKYPTKYMKSSTGKNSLQDIYKITPNETSDKTTKILSLAENNKTGTISSNSYGQQVSIDIKDPECVLTEKSSQSIDISKPIANRGRDEEIQSKSDNHMFEPDSCLLITDKTLRVATADNSFVKNNKLNKLNTRCANQNIESKNIKNDCSISTYNNSEIIGLTQKSSQNHQNVNDSQALSSHSYGFETLPKNLNGTSHTTKTLSKLKNRIYDNTMIPCYKDKIDHEVSSSNNDKKKSLNIYSKSDFTDYHKDKIFEMRTENLGNNNITTLCKKNVYDVVTPTSTSNTNQDIRELIKDSKNNDVHQFFNTNYPLNSYDSFHISQPNINYDKYKIQKQISLQNVGHEQYNLNVSDTSNSKNYYQMSSAENKGICEIKSESSWNTDDTHKKDFYDYKKIIQSKCIENSSVHSASRYNSNIRIVDNSCPKITNQVDRNLGSTKNYPYSTSETIVEPLIPPYPNSHIKRFSKKCLPLATSESKGLTQLQMNPPDFSKISLIESTQKENDISLNPNDYSTIHKKKTIHPVTSQNFDEISKKFNYIKDLQLKNPNNNEQQSRFKESFNTNFDSQRPNTYSNLYVKAPNFSAENFSKSDKIQKKNNFSSTFNTDPISTLSNDLPTMDESNILHTRNYQELLKDNSTIGLSIQYIPEINKNEFHNQQKNNCDNVETRTKADNNEYYHKKCRSSDKINQYYSPKQLYREENLTPTYKEYNQDISGQKNVIYNNSLKPSLHTEQFPHNYFQYPNNYENCDRIKRTTSVIQSGKKVNLTNVTSFVGNKSKDIIPQPIPNNWNEKTIQQQEISNCLCQNTSTLNHSYNPFSNNPQIIGSQISPANIQNSVWQISNDEALQQPSQHLEMVQNSTTNSSLQNSTYIQRSQNNSPLTKTIIKQLKKPSVPLPLDMPQSYYNPTGTKEQRLVLDMNTDSNNYNTHLHSDKAKQVKATDLAGRSTFKYSTGSLSKCSPEMPRTVQKPNYREMINHVYAMRNSTTEDDLNLQIIKRTLNCDISNRKPEITYEHHAPKKLCSTYSSQNSFYYPSCDERKINVKKNHFNMDNKQIGYIESSELNAEQPYNMSIPNNDISVTFSKVTKSKEIKAVTAVEKKGNMNSNSDYPKAIITKVVNKKSDNLPFAIDATSSRHQITLNGPTTKKQIAAPLDLSVKTVKTKADSTGCDDGNIHSFIPIVEGNRSAPKFVFQPNFSNSVDNNREMIPILHTVTSSEKLKNTHNRGTYPKLIQTNNNTSCVQEYFAEGKCCFNNVDSFSPSQLNFSPDPKIILPETKHKDEGIININKIKSKSVHPSSDIDIKIDRNPIYHNDQIVWQQTTRTQNYSTMHKKYIQKDFNNSKIHKFENPFLQKTNDITSMQSIKQQIDNKIQNNLAKNNKIVNDSIIPMAGDFNHKMDIDYSMKKRSSDMTTKQITAKKIRVDDIYKAHLEEQTKEALNKNFIVHNIESCNLPVISDNLDQKYKNNEQIPFGAQTNAELAYCNLNSEKLRKKIWYPPIPEAKHNQENVSVSFNHQSSNKIVPSETINGATISILINSTPRGADQNVISKLKNSLEMRENEKQKLFRLAENNEKNLESSKSDIASLLAARIRTKGELKGFHSPVISEIKKVNESNDSNVIKTKQISEKIYDDFSQYERNSAFDILDWRSACNDFVEQLKVGVNKKQGKKLRITKMTKTDENEKSIESHSEIECECDSKNSFVNQIKSHCIPCNEQNTKDMMSDSSDEDKPLLLLRQQNNSQSNNDLPKHTDSDNTIQSVDKEKNFQICNELPVNATHNSIVERLSEKIGRNIREKQRIEQEKRLAARLGKTSSSESEDNKRNPRPKKLKMAKTRSTNGISNRELSDTDSSATESISMGKNLVRNREMFNKRKYDKLENIDIKTEPEQSNIDVTKLFTEKQIMTKAEMKFMVPSIKIERNIIEQSKVSNLSEESKDNHLSEESKEIKENNVNNKSNCGNYKSKIKKLSSTTTLNKKTEIQLEETMTRSKRRKALENQIANSKILRNDKVIKYIYIDRTKKRIDKKQGKNIKDPKSLRFKSKTDKKNESSHFSSASSVEFETETVSDRLRPRIMSVDNNKNYKRDIQSNTKIIKEKVYIEKKKTHTKRNLFKNKKTEKYNTSKFPPGWENQVYEYKKSLKIPLRLITIKGPHNHRISTSLPDLDSHSSDDTASTKPKMISQKIHSKKLQEPMSINCEKLENKFVVPFSEKANSSVDVEIQEKISPPKSIIDVLHSRVIRSKKPVKKNIKTVNRLLPRCTNELELLPTPTVNKVSESIDEHHNVFKTEILKSRTRTETRNLKNKELIREVFGGEDRPASAPPEIRNLDNKLEIISFEKKYEEYLQKMNVDFGERIRKNNKEIVTESKEVISNHSMDVNNSVFKPDNDNAMHPEYLKDNGIENSENVKGKTVHIIPDRDDVVPNLFKHKRNNKYRRKGSSGFDYIRKKKKPSSALSGMCNQEHLKRKKPSPIEFHNNRDENDVCKEIQKWVLNKSVGQSALHKAARLGYLDVIVYCLERMGMNPDPKDNAGYTPLHEACSKGRLDIARVLLQYGANHSETAHSGIRPLHEASENGYIEIVRLLLSYGADPLLTTYSGQTPLMLSESNEMEQFLKNHLYDVQNTGPYKQPWKFPGPWKIFDPYKYGYDVLTGAPNFEQISDINACEISDRSFENENTSLALDIINKNKFIFNSSCSVNEKIKPNSAVLGKKQKYLNATVKENESIILDEGEIFQLEEADIPLPPLYLLKDEGSSKWVLLSDLCNLLKVKSKDTLLKQICPSTPPSTINKELLRELKMSDFLEKATCLQLLCAGEKINIRASKVILVKYNERVQTLLGVKTVVMKF